MWQHAVSVVTLHNAAIVLIFVVLKFDTKESKLAAHATKLIVAK
jgi:hypothetical protein